MLKPPSRYGLPIGGLCIPWNHGKTLAADFLLRSSRNMVSCLGEGYHMVPSWRISWSCVWWSLIITLLSLCYTLSRFISIYDNKRLRYSTDDIYIYIIYNSISIQGLARKVMYVVDPILPHQQHEHMEPSQMESTLMRSSCNKSVSSASTGFYPCMIIYGWQEVWDAKKPPVMR